MKSKLLQGVGYYLSIILPLVVAFIVCGAFLEHVAIAGIQDLKTFSILDIILLGTLIPFFIALSGLFFFVPSLREAKNKKKYLQFGWNKDKKIIFAYVSKGVNVEALNRAVATTKAAAEAAQCNYEIEVVTDYPVKINSTGVLCYTVPKDYKTHHGTKYKARALQYLLEQRDKRLGKQQDVWVLHLDEESCVAESAIIGINKFINQNSQEVIGQGEIQYNSYAYGKNKITSAADNYRVGEDLARIRFSFVITQSPIFGFHGSYLLISNKLEQQISFDVTDSFSLHEDTYISLYAIENKIKAKWVDGVIKEQSPATISDFFVQRNRWYSGTNAYFTGRVINWKARFTQFALQGWYGSGWFVTLLVLGLMIINLSALSRFSFYLAAFSLGVIYSQYFVGAYRSLETLSWSGAKKLIAYIYSLSFIPFGTLLEGLGFMTGIFKKQKTFRVIKK